MRVQVYGENEITPEHKMRRCCLEPSLIRLQAISDRVSARKLNAQCG